MSDQLFMIIMIIIWLSGCLHDHHECSMNSMHLAVWLLGKSKQ